MVDAAQQSNVIFRSALQLYRSVIFQLALKLYHWQREWKAHTRHIGYWLIAGSLIAWAVSNKNPWSPVNTAPRHRDWTSFWFWSIAAIVVFLAVVGLVLTIQGLNRVGPGRTVSRSVVLIAFALGVAAVTLYQAQRMGVHIESCAMVGNKEHCGGVASERHVFGMLAWQGANVVPVLDIPKSTGWTRPAWSSDPVVIAIILLVRLWVAIGLLAVIKHLWDKWSAGPSSQPPTA
jgi:hypothetical protein